MTTSFVYQTINMLCFPSRANKKIVEKRYRSEHHFNPYTLVHVYQDGQLTVRKWIDDSGKPVVTLNLKEVAPLDRIIDDIELCFSFTGAAYEKEIKDELFKEIYETHLPRFEIRRADRMHRSRPPQKWMKKSQVVNCNPKNYHELFSIIGDVGKVKSGDYIVYKYPDSVALTLKEIDGVFYYSYYR